IVGKSNGHSFTYRSSPPRYCRGVDLLHGEEERRRTTIKAAPTARITPRLEKGVLMNTVETRRCPECQRLERVVIVDDGKAVLTIAHPLTPEGCAIAPSPRQQQRNRRFLHY